LRDAVLRAEGDGYDTTWVFDHFDGAMVQGDRPMLECFTLLGALAAATSTIGLGTLVANVANRHPAVLAEAASSVQRISGGRFTLGLGAGTAPESKWSGEHAVRGIPLYHDMADRHAAVGKQIRTIRDLPEPMKVIVGVNSVRLSRVAGTIADGINVRMSNDHAGDFIKAAREAAANRSFEISGWSFGPVESARVRADELELDRLVIVELGPVA
ncbi:MAG TPA: LLM class flavin-dependent oxidoreductase, partial [Ilumatobacteraceae bacterium]|nr:LLM class flavin-dependent oxidoreductase [Ilumatobacteraceae bacterium]